MDILFTLEGDDWIPRFQEVSMEFLHDTEDKYAFKIRSNYHVI